MSFDVNEYYSKLQENDVILSYKGSITSEIINNILEDIENKFMEIDEVNIVKKKVYNVLVESLQNLFHHAEEIPDVLNDADYNNVKFGILVIKKIEKNYLIITGNFINSNRIKPLKEKIDKINSLSQDELKDMYKFILNHQKLTAKGGGGLGLVDIARKTGNKIDYSFLSVNKDYCFFNLDINVS
jgi:hypothetical protein